MTLFDVPPAQSSLGVESVREVPLESQAAVFPTEQFQKESWTTSYCALQNFAQRLKEETDHLHLHFCETAASRIRFMMHWQVKPTMRGDGVDLPPTHVMLFRCRWNPGHHGRGQTHLSGQVASYLLQIGMAPSSWTTSELSQGFPPESGLFCPRNPSFRQAENSHSKAFA